MTLELRGGERVAGLQIAGVGYIAMIVSRLVGLLVMSRRPDAAAETAQSAPAANVSQRPGSPPR